MRICTCIGACKGKEGLALGWRCAKELTPPAPCSEDAIRLPNETKIKFSNAFNAMHNHSSYCEECAEYIYNGEGDLCFHGKDIIANEMAYSDTKIEFAVKSTPPTDAKVGEKWGAYYFHADGFWRLYPPNEKGQP